MEDSAILFTTVLTVNSTRASMCVCIIIIIYMHHYILYMKIHKINHRYSLFWVGSILRGENIILPIVNSQNSSVLFSFLCFISEWQCPFFHMEEFLRHRRKYLYFHNFFFFWFKKTSGQLDWWGKSWNLRQNEMIF